MYKIFFVILLMITKTFENFDRNETGLNRKPIHPKDEVTDLTTLYCEFKESVPCRTKCRRSRGCGFSIPFKTMSDHYRNFITKLHNDFRNKYASGKMINHYTKIPYMLAVSYDKECEFLAGCHAKQCMDTIPEQHSTDKTLLGVNVFTQIDPVMPEVTDELIESAFKWFIHQQSLNNWKNEIPNSNTVENLQPMLQVVAQHMKYVGCAYIHSLRVDVIGSHFTFICVYKPAGTNDVNFVKKCSNFNDVYENLCGDVRPLTEDMFKTSTELDSCVRIRSNIFVIILILFFLL